MLGLALPNTGIVVTTALIASDQRRTVFDGRASHAFAITGICDAVQAGIGERRNLARRASHAGAASLSGFTCRVPTRSAPDIRPGSSCLG